MSIAALRNLEKAALANDGTIDAAEARQLLAAAESPEDRRLLRTMLTSDKFEAEARTLVQRGLYAPAAPVGFEGTRLGRVESHGYSFDLRAKKNLGPAEGFATKDEAVRAARAAGGVAVVLEDAHHRFHALTTDLAAGPRGEAKAGFAAADNPRVRSMELIGFLPSESIAPATGKAGPVTYGAPDHATAFDPGPQKGGHGFKRVNDGGRTAMISFTAKMWVDTDGAPRVARTKAEADQQNAAAAKRGERPDWVFNADHLPQTSLAWKKTGPGGRVERVELDSRTVPYVVASPELLAAGVRAGDLVLVKNGDKQVYAVVGDAGPAGHVGEASMATCRALGMGDDPQTGGTSAQKIEYIVLPGTGGLVEGEPKSFDELQRIGAQAFEDARERGVVK